MSHGSRWWLGLAGLALLLAGCPGDTEIADGSSNGSGGSGGRSGSGGAGRASLGGSGGNSGRGGTGGQDPGGSGGSGGAGRGAGTGGTSGGGASGGGASGGGASGGGASGGGCPNALPALCRVCADNSCGDPVCVSGRWEFRCPEDGNAGQGGSGGGLRWYTTCGDPVCMSEPDPFDDPNIPNCTGEQHGDACTDRDAQCDGVASCGATLLCTDRDPTMQPGGCPISRARFKQDIEYLGEQELRGYHDQLMSLQLASYHYRTAPEAPRQLGFIIEDIEPSVAVRGDHVNLYGYLSMTVAALQVQQQQIRELEQELQALRDERGEDAAALVCQP